MKTIQEIFFNTHLIPDDKLVQHRCKQAILMLLPPSATQYISQIFVKNAILYVAVNHEGVIFELDYKLKSVKSAILQTVKEQNCHKMQFEKIKVYYKQARQTTPVAIKWTEKERSSGEFINMLQNDTLYKLAEEIRGLICKNR